MSVHFFFDGVRVPPVPLHLNASQREILQHLMTRKKPICQKEIQIVLNIPSSTVSYNLKKLMDARCIERSVSASGQYEYGVRAEVAEATPDGTSDETPDSRTDDGEGNGGGETRGQGNTEIKGPREISKSRNDYSPGDADVHPDGEKI